MLTRLLKPLAQQPSSMSQTPLAQPDGHNATLAYQFRKGDLHVDAKHSQMLAQGFPT